MHPPTRVRLLVPLAFLGAFLLLTAAASFAGVPVSEKAIVLLDTPAPFVPPPMFGDFGPRMIITNSLIPPVPRAGQPAVTSYGPFKIGENESPLPQDRVYLSYNFYSELGGSNFQRETLGFEKTIMGGDASLSLRVPFFQFRSDFEIDDLSVFYKQKLLHDGGFTLSGGLGVTIPVNAYHPALGGKKYVALFQPFLGYLWQRGSFFVHGFSSVAVPTDDVLPLMLFNDLGIGWNIKCGGGLINAVVPTFEVHVNTPLNHLDKQDRERRHNSVDLTMGAHVQLGKRIWVGLGVGSTVSHPRLFNVEGLASLNWMF